MTDNQCPWICPICGGRCGGWEGHPREHQCPTHYVPKKKVKKMMSEWDLLWDEKPEPEDFSYIPGDMEAYGIEKIDAWLEKLKNHYDTIAKEHEYREYIDNKIIKSASKEQELIDKLEAIRNLIAEAEAGTGIGDEFFTMSLHYTKLLKILEIEK